MKQQLDDLLDTLEAFQALMPSPIAMKKPGIKYRQRAKLLKAAAQVTEDDSTRRALLAEVGAIEKVFGARATHAPRGRPVGTTRDYAYQERLLMAVLVWSGQRPVSAARTVSGLLKKRGHRTATANAIRGRWSKAQPNLSGLRTLTLPLKLGDLLRLEELIF